MPMRAVPFRVVCLLGMNDGDFPRRAQHAGECTESIQDRLATQATMPQIVHQQLRHFALYFVQPVVTQNGFYVDPGQRARGQYRPAGAGRRAQARAAGRQARGRDRKAQCR